MNPKDYIEEPETTWRIGNDVEFYQDEPPKDYDDSIDEQLAIMQDAMYRLAWRHFVGGYGLGIVTGLLAFVLAVSFGFISL